MTAPAPSTGPSHDEHLADVQDHQHMCTDNSPLEHAFAQLAADHHDRCTPNTEDHWTDWTERSAR